MRDRFHVFEVKRGLVPAFLALLVLAISSFAQDLPDRIRGYKVHRDKISINSQAGGSHASINIGEAAPVDISLAGVTFELPAQFTTANQSGKVEFVSFYNVRVNGVKVEPEDYAYGFEFRKGERMSLPKPVRIFLPASAVINAAWKEMTETRSEWTVTGRVFVFGRFRRYGFYHKRVVPIELNLTIKNPLLQK